MKLLCEVCRAQLDSCCITAVVINILVSKLQISVVVDLVMPLVANCNSWFRTTRPRILAAANSL